MEESQKRSGEEGKPQRGATSTQSTQYQQYTYPFQYQQQQYGTFQPTGPVYTQSQPAIGFPQPSPPPGSAAAPPLYAAAGPGYFPQGLRHQRVSGYAVVTEGQPIRSHHNSVPCCGIGIGWILFIAGFFFAAIPWYVGAFILLCVGVDYKEKPGLIACTIAALIAAVAILLGLTNSASIW
ncbi:60S ribosomal protein L18a-like protein [Rhynchospora pubera]|uniref:60S ribosomal protein L18a-like protein n=1 Tax=Rhynchospora pubera TaxID=906938 RepID=A0AAV8HY13_9POAL|nr:60S ribosomal protein L18a-like protein [Rhynchospora pubera]